MIVNVSTLENYYTTCAVEFKVMKITRNRAKCVVTLLNDKGVPIRTLGTEEMRAGDDITVYDLLAGLHLEKETR